MTWRVDKTPSPESLRAQLRDALAAVHVTAEWQIAAAIRVATVEDGVISLPTPIGRLAIDKRGARYWSQHYMPAEPPIDDSEIGTDADVGAILNATSRWASR